MKNIVGAYFEDIVPLLDKASKLCEENGLEMVGCIFSPVPRSRFGPHHRFPIWGWQTGQS
jgi:hypothetical protein